MRVLTPPKKMAGLLCGQSREMRTIDVQNPSAIPLTRDSCLSEDVKER